MKRVARARAKLPASAETVPPVTTLPVDCTGNGSVVCPMDGNDTLGDCGYAMCDHVDTIRTFGQGKPGFSAVHADVAKLEAQYEAASGGDNGSDEPMLVGPGGSWMTGIAGDPTCVVVDHLDVDVTDLPLRDYCIDQFYAVCMAWSVPDDVLQNFTTGVQFLAADMPDPNNGHFTPITDIDASENVKVYTWGSYFIAGPAFLASVQPECFVTFSALQFGKAGYDSHGRHVSDVAAAWVSIGGNASLVAPVVAAFPAKATAPTVGPASPVQEPAS
jgi:hypothetical protein